VKEVSHAIAFRAAKLIAQGVLFPSITHVTDHENRT
jgi:hypothetical protein